VGLARRATAVAWIAAAAAGVNAGEGRPGRAPLDDDAQARESLYSAEATAWVLAYSARSEWPGAPGDMDESAGYRAVASMEWISPIFAEALPPILEDRVPGDAMPGAPAASPFMARVGRQAARSGGLLGRYDGLMASTPLGSAARLNLLGGFPVDTSSEDRMSGKRSFYAVSLDLPPLVDGFRGQIFATRQRVLVAERSFVGASLGFNRERGFGFAAADYDLESRELGMAMFVAIARIDDRTAVKAFADLRRNSSPTAYKATQGKPLQSVEQLLDTLSQSDIRKIALDRGAERRTFTLGASRQLAPSFQVAGDITLRTQQDGRKSSASELSYALAATWTDPAEPLGYATAALQRVDAVAFRSYIGSLGGYYPISEGLGIGPDLALEARRAGDADLRWTYRPSLRLEYLAALLRLDLQLGLELAGTADGSAGSGTGYFYSIGYEGKF
jgi:hypothetical protein